MAILDELTTGLDPQARRDTWALIEKVRDAGVTIVLVTHFMDEAERLCDRLVDHRRRPGRRRRQPGVAGRRRRGPPQRSGCGCPRAPPPALVDGLARLAEVDTVAAVDGGYEVTGGPRVLPAVVLALAEHDVVPDEIRTLSRTLEDVFVDVTGAHPHVLEAAS